EAFDYPASLFAPRLHRPRRPSPDRAELADAVATMRRSERPLIVAGGGVLYAEAADALAGFASRHGIPVAETQAGKGALPAGHPLAAGAIGVTGTAAANTLAREADVVLAIGTRLADFTTGSRALWPSGTRLIGLNVQAFDAGKHGGSPLIGDALVTLTALGEALDGWASKPGWQERVAELRASWDAEAARAVGAGNERPGDAQVLGAVNRVAGPEDVVVGAAGGLPGELHKLWRTHRPGGYHLEYGFSCMGYEIAGGLGVRLARDAGEVFVMLGDGSYLMMNSELQTAVRMGKKLIVVVLDNRGFGCIDRLQRACGGSSFNNLLPEAEAWVDFAAHARALGADAAAVDSVAGLETALEAAKRSERTTVIVIATDPQRATRAGGAWWDVAVPEVSARAEVGAARSAYERAVAARDAGA
ncbi:MAG: 3D-(3,5/4)-trihydroxycyclohexane-1,2-dione acylhydrolase (decyclizing), partial [Acetobacteraceae bacterium]|nr:3D-(3,5/4)-trihydroxycyclohexane-1,2-dione acylhydrolase (decyclizing) [Acetobacteraceae bacterium]